MLSLRSLSRLDLAESYVRKQSLARRLSWTVVIVILLSMYMSEDVVAQTRITNSKLKIAGVVTDETGTRVPRVVITLETIDGRMVARAVSDNQGDFSFGYRHRDDFMIVANKRGFRTAASEIAESKAATVRIILESEPIEE